jgi:diguanylate cyclase (GGDEF)-like protein/PAS domain S-box-containing protein/putative nucleotidyltransferase with HDIG domain
MRDRNETAKRQKGKKIILTDILQEKRMLRTIIILLIFIFFGSIHLHYAWNNYDNIASSEAITLAESLETLLNTEYIPEFTGTAEDLEKHEYIMVKQSLIRLVETTDQIGFAYIFSKNDGETIYLLDSEPFDSIEYSPQGQVFREESALDRETFLTEDTIPTEPILERWSTWISVLVPIKDPANGDIIAVLGIDYPAAVWQRNLWKQMIPDFMIFFGVFIVYLMLIRIWNQHTRLKKLSKKIEYSEALYHSVFDQAPIGIAIMSKDILFDQAKFSSMNINPMFEQILGRTKDDLKDLKWSQITDPEDLPAEIEKFEQFRAGEINSYFMEKRFIKPDGSAVWVNMLVESIYLKNNKQDTSYICLIQDITEQKLIHLEMEQHQKLLQSFVDSSQDLIYLKDQNFRYVIVNKAFCDILGVSIDKIIGEIDCNLLDADTAAITHKTDVAALNQNTTVDTVERIKDIYLDSRKFPVVYGKGKKGVGAYIRDITENYRHQEIINKFSETNRIITECMIKPFIDTKEQLDFALHEAMKLTGSKYGHIYLYDEKTKEFTLHSWTDGVVEENSYPIKKVKFQLDKIGILGESVRQRKPYVINDYEAPNAKKKGYPKGHIQVCRYMSIPIFENNRIVAVVGFGNKEFDYTANDIDVMTVLLNGVWIAIRKKEKEKETERLLERTQSMINNHEAIMFILDPKTGNILEANNSATKFYGFSKHELLHMSIQEINMLSSEEGLASRMKVLDNKNNYYTLPHRLKSGEIRIVDVYNSAINYNDQKVLFAIIFDVTGREEIREQNEYLAYHDHLTGVYNRRFFDEEFDRRKQSGEYPIALIMGDVNGLKFHNDTYGHLVGDAALKNIAHRIEKNINKKDVLARISGDEFVIITSKMNEESVKQFVEDLMQKLNHNYGVDEKNTLTISFGYGIQRHKEDSMDRILKEAETYMYNRKYFDSKSTRSKTVNVIMETLFAKSEREKMHSERVGAISESIAKKMLLSEQLVDRIRVAGLLHDIGKIGIDERVLNKNGKLTNSEWETMKLHSAKGAEILERTVEYIDIANVVLSHHERYDGIGYPNGLKGENIPLEARIIAVADSYDAMTNTRTYRKEMGNEAAINELKRCSGYQFDPEIVDVFVDQVIKNDVDKMND